jgi:hypothetical protein
METILPPSQRWVGHPNHVHTIARRTPDGEVIRFGCVNYIDFKKRFAGTYDRVFYKRKSLSHEAEVRGVLNSGRSSPDAVGVSVPIDLERLADRVVVSPFAPTWFSDASCRP